MRLFQNFGSAASLSATGAVSDLRWDELRTELLLRTGDLPAAINAVNTVLPDLAKLPPEDQVALLRLASQIYVRAGGPDGRLKLGDVYKALLERAPDDIWTMNNLAVYLIDQAQPAQAPIIAKAGQGRAS